MFSYTTRNQLETRAELRDPSKFYSPRRISAALLAGLSAVLLYLSLAIYAWIAEGETLRAWYAIFLGFLFLGVTSLSLGSSFLAWLARRSTGQPLPLPVRLLWGVCLAVGCAMLLDLPGINFYRWQLYAAAASAGFLAALVNYWMGTKGTPGMPPT